MSKLRFVFIGPRGLLRSGWRLLILIAALFAAGTGLDLVLTALGASDGTTNGKLHPVPLLANTLILLLVVFLVYWLVMRLLDRRSPATMGLPLRRPWLGGLGTGLALGALPVALTVVVASIGGSTTIEWVGFDAASIVAVTVPAVLALFLVSSFEEIILRGYPMQLLAEGAGPWLAALLSGAVFGIAHVSNPGANVLGLVNTAANGVILAWIVIRTGSLWIACGYHAGWNICGALIFGMRLSGIDVPGAFIHTELLGPEWLTGGSYGFEGSTIAGLVELVVLVCALLAASRLPGHPELTRYFRRWKTEEPSAVEVD